MTLAKDEMRELYDKLVDSVSPTALAYEKPLRPKDPIQIMKDYLLVKFDLGDWNGVSDAAMDIREMLAKDKK